MKHWTPERHKKFKATLAKKRAAKNAELTPFTNAEVLPTVASIISRLEGAIGMLKLFIGIK